MKWDQCKGNRLHKRFIWMLIRKPPEKSKYNKDGDTLWWDDERNIWTENPIGHSSSCKSCRSLRAFRRHLRKHPEIKGYTAILVNRFAKYDVECIVK